MDNAICRVTFATKKHQKVSSNSKDSYLKHLKALSYVCLIDYK